MGKQDPNRITPMTRLKTVLASYWRYLQSPKGSYEYKGYLRFIFYWLLVSFIIMGVMEYV